MVKAPEGYFDYEAPIMAGYDFINKQPSGINYRSSLDNKFNVIVPYKFSVPQELAMLKVFYDTLLTLQELAGFGKYELSVLRNLVFAKHNYKFEAEFWQAYFNLFEFYRSDEKRKSRTKDVERQFSLIDKKNLEMIRKREKNLRMCK
jgi:predicted choloylglycine hydrolase